MFGPLPPVGNWEAMHLLCPVHILTDYVNCMAPIRYIEQLLWCRWKGLVQDQQGCGTQPSLCCPCTLYRHCFSVICLVQEGECCNKVEWSTPRLFLWLYGWTSTCFSVHVIPGGILDWQRWGLAEFVFVAPDPYYSMCCVCSVDVSKCCLQGLDCVLC